MKTPIPVVVIGGGGHGRVLCDAARLQGSYDIRMIVDAQASLRSTKLDGVPIVGGDEELPRILREGVRHAVMAIGSVANNSQRAAIFARVKALGFVIVNVVHPSAVISDSAKMGEGTVVLAGAVVGAGTVLGANVIINTRAAVDHDCSIGDHVHIAPGAVLSGAVAAGELAYIGAGATIKQGTKIGHGALVGLGAAVIRDVPDGTAVAGVPARPFRKHDARGEA